MSSPQSSTDYEILPSTTANSTNEHPDHIPSDGDFLSVKYLLKNCGLPVEIIDDTPDNAQYWPRIHRECSLEKRAVVYHQAGQTFQNADWCYVVSPPVPQDVKVRAVKFVTQSCDQGWGGEPGHQGTYQGSWTWFEAAIIRGEPWWLSEALGGGPIDLYRQGLAEDVRSAARAAEVRSQEEEGSGWHVGVNVTAEGSYKEHTNVWLRTDEGVKQESMRGLLGLSHEFVRLLEPGDRVALMARAMFPGWVDNVKNASIDMFYT
ncbi:hypothetical protein EDD18DRAFT_1291999 [Armillaria luteobubalina]|uniref:Uncharacterized protein n=1 Tax=Armillaria luteobubalina TaxID=153913 RepID=A0AA39PQK6_9AGAR|nr:hypothetical protein EDD18DRAFT_1291954 [Armillaria luteobubalina]KAK0488023.1 hypothetical protein EDD18DRAFT_1291999 [Armillaria luteobubalina]